MPNLTREALVGLGTLVALSCSAPVMAEDDLGPAAATVAAAPARAGPLGGKPVGQAALAANRGGAQVVNDMKLKGVVTDNQASNLTTGNNMISDGAFSGAAGLPMVIQNSGNNVLIQNATIVNVQVK